MTLKQIDRVILPWLPGYDRAWLSRDVLAGLAAGAVVIPQAMAYATVADLPVQVGLYTCMVPMAVYALLGGSRTLSVSTTSTIAILTASTLMAAGVAAGSSDPARTLAMLTLLVGAILLIARVLRLGVLIDNISEATLTGVKVGVGLTVAAGQLPKLLGIPGNPSADNFFSELRAVLHQLDRISWATVIFSAATIAVLLGTKRIAPKAPAPLVAVVGGILLVALTSIESHVALIAHVPSGLPTPVAPSARHFKDLLPGAFAIAIMVFLETLAVARTVRRRSEPPIDNQQEMLAGGLSCAIGALFRAMPSAGGFSQTAINQGAGARTQLSELVTVVLAVACALFLGSVLSDLPQATLGCMVVIAVLGLISPAELAQFWRLSRLEFWVAAATAACGLIFGMLPAVLVGVVLTLLLVLVELDRVGLTELQPTADDADVQPADDHTAPVSGLIILRVNGPLYTANVRSTNGKLVAAVDARPDTRVVVVDLTAQGRLSLTAVHQFSDLEQQFDERGVALWVVAVPPQALKLARQAPRWQELAEAGRLYPTALAAVRAFRQHPAPVS
jgi:sulfate permease, SulP family